MVRLTYQKREVFMFDMNSIKVNSLDFTMPSPESYCERVKNILDRHSVKKVSDVHSAADSSSDRSFTFPVYIALPPSHLF